MRRKYFTEANNSLHELMDAMDLAAAIGARRLNDASNVQRLGVGVDLILSGNVVPHWNLDRRGGVYPRPLSVR